MKRTSAVEFESRGVMFSFDVSGWVCVDVPAPRMADLSQALSHEVATRMTLAQQRCGQKLRDGLCMAEGCNDPLPDGQRGGVCPLCSLAWQKAREGSAVPEAKPATSMPPTATAPALAAQLDEVERRQLLEALARCGGSKSAVARELGVQRTTLYYKLKRLGIEA